MQNYNRYGYRHMRTTQELRTNCDPDHEQYVRGRRKNLPDAWDDRYIPVHKCWKKHRKQQYHNGSRGQRHELIFENTERLWSKEWKLCQYFKEHKIPHRIEQIKERVYHETVITHTWQEYVMYRTSFTNYKGETFYKDHCGSKLVRLDKPIIKKYRSYKSKGLRIIWWSNKDIGVEYILGRIMV